MHVWEGQAVITPVLSLQLLGITDYRIPLDLEKIYLATTYTENEI